MNRPKLISAHAWRRHLKLSAAIEAQRRRRQAGRGVWLPLPGQGQKDAA